jgi:hypothetical protein
MGLGTRLWGCTEMARNSARRHPRCRKRRLRATKTRTGVIPIAYYAEGVQDRQYKTRERPFGELERELRSAA